MYTPTVSREPCLLQHLHLDPPMTVDQCARCRLDLIPYRFIFRETPTSMKDTHSHDDIIEIGGTPRRQIRSSLQSICLFSHNIYIVERNKQTSWSSTIPPKAEGLFGNICTKTAGSHSLSR